MEFIDREIYLCKDNDWRAIKSDLNDESVIENRLQLREVKINGKFDKKIWKFDKNLYYI